MEYLHEGQSQDVLTQFRYPCEMQAFVRGSQTVVPVKQNNHHAQYDTYVLNINKLVSHQDVVLALYMWYLLHWLTQLLSLQKL